MTKYRIDKNLFQAIEVNDKVNKSIASHTRKINEPYSGSYYHYTSPEGIHGILKNRNLFFTDCQFLNDRVERLHMNDELRYFWSRNKDDYLKEYYQMLSSIQISEYKDSAFSLLEGSTDLVECRYFVFSASSKQDSLDMWRYYSKNNSCEGYCIMLNTYALIDEWIDRDTGIAIEHGYVIYNSSEKQTAIRKQVEFLYEIWSKYKRTNDLDSLIIKSYSAWVSYASLFFKHERFSVENEYRMVAIAPVNIIDKATYTYNNVETKMYDFRIVQGVLTPYLKIPFCTWNVEECYAISEVVVGPSSNEDLKVSGLKYLIQSLEYTLPDLSIKKSETPIRY